MSVDKNARIAKNTGLLYFRSFVCLLLSLYSSRLILQALGVEDFGIYNAVGGLASMFWIVSSALSSAVGRFLNYEMGRKNADGVNEVFSLSLNIMIILAFIAAVLAETLGIWFIHNKMTIPLNKMDTAIWIFHLSVITMVIGIITIPYSSAIIAHERMGYIALINITETSLKLGAAVLLTWCFTTGDKLLYYALFLAAISLFVNTSYSIYARHSFKECRFRPILQTKRLGEMFRFAFWNFIASISGTFSGQGTNMALNVYHGPVLNTARGLTTTVSNSVSLLVYNFTVSINPQVTQSYAAGNLERCRKLVFLGTRFAAFLMLLIIIPLCLETEFVLTVWLGSFPDNTVTFVRLSLITIFLNVFIYLFSVAKNASGNIRSYQLTIALLSLLEFVFAWLFLYAGMKPEWIYIAPIILTTTKIAVSIASVRNNLDYSLQEVYLSVLLPVSIVTVLSLIIPTLLFIVMSPGWIRFLIVLFTSVSSVALSAFFLGCDHNEQQLVKRYTFSFLLKLFKGN